MKYISFFLLLSSAVCQISSHVDSSSSGTEDILQQQQASVEQPIVSDIKEPASTLNDVPPSTAYDASAPPSTADVPSSPPSTADVPSSPPSTADVPSSPPSTADVPSSPPSTADVPSSPPSTADVPSSPPSTADVPSGPPLTTEHVRSMKTILTEKDSDENNFWVDPVNLEALQDADNPQDESVHGSLHQISIEDIEKRLYDDEHSLPNVPLNEGDELSIQIELDSTSTPGDNGKDIESTTTEEDEATLLYKWPCSPFNLTSHLSSGLPSDLLSNSPKVIQLTDDEEMVSDILHRMNESSGCALVMFYSPFCEFSMRMAPLYNAVGRSYSELAVLSVDAQESMNMAARYGIIGIPTVLLFYSGRAVARFNRSRTPDEVASFIQDFTGFSPTLSPLEVLHADMEGPMPTQLLERTTTHLSVALTFLMAFAAWHLVGGVAWRAVKRAAVSARDLFVHEKEE